MNYLIVDQLNKLIKQIKAEYLNAQLNNDIKETEVQTYRLKQTKRALSTILLLDLEIVSENDLKGIPGIGKGTLRRIKEILETGKLSELEYKYDSKRQTTISNIQELLKVIGIGDWLARKLVIDHNITTVDELKEAVTKGKIRVSRQVKLGLKYYDTLQKNIPRNEITQTEKYLTKKAAEIDPNLHILICGSYRRGLIVSGDIDVMIYHPDVKFVRQIYLIDYGPKSYLELFVDLLEKENFLLDHLSVSKMKYMGFCKYKSYPVRRIDIRFMPYNSIPSAMLYFTGPYELNQEMRERAKKRNMLLNEYGLFILDSQGNRFSVPINSEKDIFEELGMTYLTPIERESYSLKSIN